MCNVRYNSGASLELSNSLPDLVQILCPGFSQEKKNISKQSLQGPVAG